MDRQNRNAFKLSQEAPTSLRPQSSAEARALDAAATGEAGMPSLLLMENAARAVAERAELLRASGEVLVLAGKGNNGGDGLAAARWLAPHARVALLAAPDPERCPDAALQLRILERSGVSVSLTPELEELNRLAEGASLLVDALLGTGLGSAPRGRVADWIRFARDQEMPVLAVDLPSGLSADSGEAFDPCVRAVHTVTFARPKRGLLLRDGPGHAGKLEVASLGLPEPWVGCWEAREEQGRS